jgi:hypothetical protein
MSPPTINDLSKMNSIPVPPIRSALSKTEDEIIAYFKEIAEVESAEICDLMKSPDIMEYDSIVETIIDVYQRNLVKVRSYLHLDKDALSNILNNYIFHESMTLEDLSGWSIEYFLAIACIVVDGGVLNKGNQKQLKEHKILVTTLYLGLGMLV